MTINEKLSDPEPEFEELARLEIKTKSKTYLLIERANSLKKVGNVQEAIKIYRQIIEINPDYKEAWNSKGEIEYNFRKYKQAIISFDEVLRIDPDDASAWNNKGVALNGLGQLEEAIQCYDKAMKINPGNDTAWNNKRTTQKELRNKRR
ncbi:tetratricopeptide repeat protein [Candidatus Woesearchaeota archaeon]|nr:tetratricopeptide repeat protein [Candidatus Woesearchaeota archaeon]